MPQFRYAVPQVVVHWLAAALVVFLLLTGTFILEGLPNDADKVTHLRLHMLLGALAGVLVVARIVLRRKLPAAPVAAGGRMAGVTHVALNVLVLVLVFSGGMLALQSGALDAVFGSGSLPADFREFTPRRIHGLVAKLAMGLIALHVAGALFHQLVLKDGLLRRMGFGRG